ncbi:resolvase [Methanobrevibacter sp. TMH8]|uniref:resolvase n=1 Tax=Methanobrevibacter sp. TMH8 TaxID=2848611 RepID=UPI001CCBD7E4|nr:resolvase [Methanobrevibacter sp. TMH8]MBZ9571496.1 resolvase [Methanobrevibacter sp. TMH8]
MTSNNNDTDYIIDDNEDENNTIHISSQLSSKMIVELMDEYPDLKKITCPPSLYKRISKKYLEVLEELGIEVEIKYNWGTRKKYKDEMKEEVINLIKEGEDPSKIAEKFNLPVKTIYYLKNTKKDEKISIKLGKKSKYSDATITKIKNLAKSGISPKKISKQEKIPLRTVYYIINKK